MFLLDPARAQNPREQPSGRAGVRSGPRPTNRPADVREDPSGAISRLGVASARSVLFTEEREAAARAFVNKHRPEMTAVLDQLAAAKPAEYQQVICDLFRTSESFAALLQEDRQRHEIALNIWKVEAQTHLLAAELVARPEQADRIKVELREAVARLADLQVEQAALEIKRLEAKLRRAEGQRQRLEGRKSEFVEERVGAILQAVGRLEAERSASPVEK